MDQSTLVGDQIDAGRWFVERFAADGNPIQAAFWAKTADEGNWFLYVATDRVDRDGPAATYRAVHDSLQKLRKPRINSSDIKVISPNRPIAREILAAMPSDPGWLTSRYNGHSLCIDDFEQTYIYPARFFKFTPNSTMTTEDVGQAILRLMSRGSGTLDPSRVDLKDGTTFKGVPFSLQLGSQKALEAQFIADGEAAPRVVRVDQIASIF